MDWGYMETVKLVERSIFSKSQKTNRNLLGMMIQKLNGAAQSQVALERASDAGWKCHMHMSTENTYQIKTMIMGHKLLSNQCRHFGQCTRTTTGLRKLSNGLISDNRKRNRHYVYGGNQRKNKKSDVPMA